MFTRNISFKNFLIKKKKLIVKKNLNSILNEKNQVIVHSRNLIKTVLVKKIQNILIKDLTIEL